MSHGVFASAVPRPAASLVVGTLFNPLYWHLVPDAQDARVRAPFYEHTLIADHDGRELARAGMGDTFTVAEVVLPETPPHVSGSQPRMELHPASYWLTSVLNRLTRPLYYRRVGRRRR